jgi:uncharacterized protein YukE
MTVQPLTLNAPLPLPSARPSAEQQLGQAEALKQAYTDFVGKTFFGQMMKAMRSTVDKPAYFHGGQAEEAFQSQLDQYLCDAMSSASATEFSDPMFARQFPQQAKLLADAEQQTQPTLTDLRDLRRY